LTVPVTAGSPGQIGIATTNPARFKKVNPGGGIIAKPLTTKPQLIDALYSPSQHYHHGNEYKGGFGGFFDPEACYYDCRYHFGRSVQTTAQILTTTKIAAYKHVMYPVRKTATCVIESKIEDGDFGLLDAGVVIDSFEFDLADMLTYQAGYTAAAHVPNTYDSAGTKTDYNFTSTGASLPSRMGGFSVATTTTPSFVDNTAGNQGNGSLAFADVAYGVETGFSAAYVSINGTNFTTTRFLTGSKIRSVRTLVSKQTLGTGRDPDNLICTEGMVTGTLIFTYEDNAALLAMMGHKQISMNIKFAGGLMGTSGIQSAMEFYIPNARINSAPLQIGMGEVVLSMEFDAIYDATALTDFKITLWNTVDASGLKDTTTGGGGAYTGTMGGVLIS